MTASRWSDIERVLDCVLDHPVVKWAEAVEAACDGDGDLVRSVDSLLRHASVLDGYLEEPAARVTALLHQMREEPERVGERLGPWRLEEEIGRGGMGVVYRGVRDDGHYDQKVAVKLLRASSGTVGAARRFALERQMLAGLDHPSIARLLDGGVSDDGQPFLVMEYVEGEPLDAYCDRRALGIEARLGLFLGVCDAVAYAHRHLVVHRDLKPDNVLVTEEDGEPRVKLLDFGIAKLLEEPGGDGSPVQAGLTQPMQRPFTPEYAAPEQVEGRAATTATDVYGLGVVLFELLTGRPPFRFDPAAPRDIERAILGDTPPYASTVAPKERRRRIVGDLDAIVAKALRKEPEGRFENARALTDDVRRNLDGLPVEARTGAAGYLVRKFVRRHRVGVAAGTLVFFALVGGLGTALWQAKRAEIAGAHAEAEAAVAEQVTTFMTGLFTAAAPWEALGDTLTAFDLLARGVAGIDSLRGQPLVQARMLQALAMSYHGLGDYGEAEVLYRRSFELHQRLHATGLVDAIDVAEAASKLGGILLSQRSEEAAMPHMLEAIRIYGEAVRVQRESQDGDSVAVAAALSSLAFAHFRLGDYVTAERLFREAIALRYAVFGADDPQADMMMGEIASAMAIEGRYDEAIPIHQNVLQRARKKYGWNNPRLFSILFNMSSALGQADSLVAAEMAVREALGIARYSYGNEHPNSAFALIALASILERQERFAEAETHYREALAVERRLYGDGHPRVTTILHHLAGVAQTRGDYAEAERRIHDVIARELRDNPGGGNRWWYLKDLADLYRETERPAEALATYEEALAGVESQVPPRSSRIRAIRTRIGETLIDAGRYAEAERVLVTMYDSLMEARDERRARPVARILVKLYEAWGRPEDAGRYYTVLTPENEEEGGGVDVPAPLR